MTNASDLLERQIKQKIRDATVRVSREDGAYTISVVSRSFDGMCRADREAAVYNTLSAVPLSLLAKIVRIECAA